MPGETAVAQRSGPRARRRPRSLVPLLLLLGIAQLCIAALIAWTVYAEHQTRAATRHETNVLLALNQLVEATLDVETGQRGYLLTGREPYLDPYLSAKQRMRQSEAVLSGLLEGSDRQDAQTHLDTLKRTIDEKLGELEQTITLARSGKHEEALKIINTDLGKRQMDAIRGEAHWLSEDASTRRRAMVGRTNEIEGWVLVLIVLLGLGSAALVFIGLRSEGSRARFEAEAEQANALREANQRAQLLARELNHRVKNLFSIVIAIVTVSGRRRPEAATLIEDIRSRIHALSLAHEVSQGQLGGETVTLDSLLRRIATPYLGEDETRIRFSGPSLSVSPRAITPLGLIFHELATNAVKYGALSADGGWVQIDWELLPKGDTGNELHLQWIELGGPTLASVPAEGTPRGFGSRMIELAVLQLDGRIEQQWPPAGAVIRLMCPWH